MARCGRASACTGEKRHGPHRTATRNPRPCAAPRVTPPPGVVLPFDFVRLVGRRAVVSGHGPLNADGSIAKPLGKLGRELTVEIEGEVEFGT